MSSQRIPLKPAWLPLIADGLSEDLSALAAGLRRQSRDRDAAMAGLQAEAMRDAELWWVDGDMTAVAVDCADDEQGFDARTGVPTPPDSALILFAGGLPILIDGQHVTALFWRRAENAIRFDVYTETTVGRLPLRRADGSVLNAKRRRWLARCANAVLALSRQPMLAHTGNAAWNESGRAKPRGLKRAERRITHPDVLLVRLRRTTDDHDDAGRAPDAGGREYACRWIVRGHYREQPYGPNHSLRRRQWIPPHVAGPADKPLIVKRVVNIWGR